MVCNFCTASTQKRFITIFTDKPICGHCLFRLEKHSLRLSNKTRRFGAPICIKGISHLAASGWRIRRIVQHKTARVKEMHGWRLVIPVLTTELRSGWYIEIVTMPPGDETASATASARPTAPVITVAQHHDPGVCSGLEEQDVDE
ncbi:uncharacterized protein LOC119461817 [Dermacentor silvarum]|uniref:uncharacterized protein LOC119461817 n=1 Tax=Dermacentor silvarum TaxID=543639 RepID=UPI0021009F1C|nr:uncharacterized protein LOC119461817 [Dermacentor silvarum]